MLLTRATETEYTPGFRIAQEEKCRGSEALHAIYGSAADSTSKTIEHKRIHIIQGSLVRHHYPADGHVKHVGSDRSRYILRLDGIDPVYETQVIKVVACVDVTADQLGGQFRVALLAAIKLVDVLSLVGF